MPPERIQQRRTPGWRKPEGALSVTRGTRWGNSFKVLDRPDWGYPALTVVNMRRNYPVPDGHAYGGFADKRAAAAFAVDLFRRSTIAALGRHSNGGEFYLKPLVGRDLMCFCTVGDPCHGDVLLILAAQYDQGLPLTGLLDAT